MLLLRDFPSYFQIYFLILPCLYYLQITGAMIAKSFHVDELDHLQMHDNFYIQIVEVDNNYCKASLLVILVHIFYMNPLSLKVSPFVILFKKIPKFFYFFKNFKLNWNKFGNLVILQFAIRFLCYD